jgi:hypothetical protein
MHIEVYKFFGEPKSCSIQKLFSQNIQERGCEKNAETNEVKSIGIVSFKQRAEILREILKKLGMSMSLDISVPRD